MRAFSSRNLILSLILLAGIPVGAGCHGSGHEQEQPVNPEAAAGEGNEQENELLLTGIRVYALHCAACHGDRRTGEGAHAPNPSLDDVENRLSRTELQTVIRGGRGLMPPFNYLSEEETKGLILYLTNGGSLRQRDADHTR